MSRRTPERRLVNHSSLPMPLPAQFIAASRKPAIPPTTNPSVKKAKENMVSPHYIYTIATL
jgi:hypothetical protein